MGFIILLLLMAAVVVGFVIRKNHRIISSILLTISTISFAFMGGIMSTLYVLFDLGKENFLLFSMIAFIVSAAVFLLILIWSSKKLIRKIFLCITILCLATMLFSIVQNLHIRNIPVVKEYDTLNIYRPDKENTKAVTIDTDYKVQAPYPKLDGATALYPIYASFAKNTYPESAYTDLSILRCTKTTGAYKSIVTGDADIIFVAGPSKEQEEYAKENNVELEYIPIGKEAFVFFVNSKNPIEDLSLEDIKGIYSGKITDWETFGVKKLGMIKAFQRAENSGSQTALEKLMGDTPIMKAPTEDVVGLMEGIIEKTSDYKNFKNAIGYSFRFFSTEMVNSKDIKLLSINGVAPTLENIENGTYPIASEFYAVIRKDADENTRSFVEWIKSSKGKEIIRKVGYTPIN